MLQAVIANVEQSETGVYLAHVYFPFAFWVDAAPQSPFCIIHKIGFETSYFEQSCFVSQAPELLTAHSSKVSQTVTSTSLQAFLAQEVPHVQSITLLHSV